MINELREGFEGRTLKSTLLLYMASTILVGVIALTLHFLLSYKSIVLLTPLVALLVISVEVAVLLLGNRYLTATPAKVDTLESNSGVSWLMLRGSFVVVMSVMALASYTNYLLMFWIRVIFGFHGSGKPGEDYENRHDAEYLTEDIVTFASRVQLWIFVGIIGSILLSILTATSTLVYLLLVGVSDSLLKLSFSLGATLVLMFMSFFLFSALSRNKRKSDWREMKRNQLGRR